MQLNLKEIQNLRKLNYYNKLKLQEILFNLKRLSPLPENLISPTNLSSLQTYRLASPNYPH